MNFTDILGSVLNQGMTRSGNQRVDHSVQNGGLGDLLNQMGGGGLGGARSSGMGTGSGGSGGMGGGLGDILGKLGKMAGAAANSGPGGSSNPMVTGGLGALIGALFGGGKGAGKGALGGSALAILGSLALKALMNRGGASTGAGSQLMAGLREPENEEEAHQVQKVSELLVKAMLNAAKADGQVDRDEIQRIGGKVAEDGLTEEEKSFLATEIEKPMDMEAMIRAVPNEQVAAQVYAASLFAIEVDTDAERRYLQNLATGLNLDQQVVAQLHDSLGVPR
jgi:uncharacterized membrane protein YebE (DUF533 family)